MGSKGVVFRFGVMVDRKLREVTGPSAVRHGVEAPQAVACLRNIIWNSRNSKRIKRIGCRRPGTNQTP